MTQRAVHVGNVAIGGGSLTLIAGPCAVESEEQIFAAAAGVASSGAAILRGGAFKARTKAGDFAGLGVSALSLLAEAGHANGLPVVTEILSADQIPAFESAGIDMYQIGARNMQNVPLLQAVAATGKPVLLKRNLAATYDEMLKATEYITGIGNENIVLCERGERGFEPYTRFTLDVSFVPAMHELSDFPVLVDPSHAAGKASLVPALAKAGVAAGADGLLIEVHPSPCDAMCDAAQALSLDEFGALAHACQEIAHVR